VCRQEGEGKKVEELFALLSSSTIASNIEISVRIGLVEIETVDHFLLYQGVTGLEEQE